MSRQTLEKILLVILYTLAFLALVHYNLINHNPESQFESLAQSFLRGHLYVGVNDGTWLDASYYKGYAYWPQGMFPAVLLMPIIGIFGKLVHQQHIQFLLNLLNIFLLYKIALKITNNKRTSLWLSFAYLFATAYIAVGLIPWSWWFAQIVATFVMLLALYEYLHKRRWFLIGLYVACAFMTRIDLFISLFFFVFSIILSKQATNKKIQQFVLLCTPVLLGIILIFLYNYFRFGSFLEFGYRYHIPALSAARNIFKEYGTWNFFYYPSNFYYLFLKGFDQMVIRGTGYLAYPFISADMWGMSIFITSPILLWCVKSIKHTLQERDVKLALLTSLFILLFLLGYFGIGTRQYGYRYALDFSPFLFLVLCYAFTSGMSNLAKFVIIASFALNYYLFPTIFKVLLH